MKDKVRTRLALSVATLLVTGGLAAACGSPAPTGTRTPVDGPAPTGNSAPTPAGNSASAPADNPAQSPAPARPGRYPTEGRPTRIAIDHNDFEAKHVGHTADGGQFFLTTPFDTGGAGARDFVALYLFDRDGLFRTAEIDAFPGGGLGHSAAADKVYRQRLAELGPVTFDRIEIAPFTVKRFGLIFGLVVEAPASDDDVWWVTVEPGDYMAFSPPWDLGEYDT